MNILINAKQLRASLPAVVERVRKGTRFTVIYRSRPAFQIVPVNQTEHVSGELPADPLYRAGSVRRSRRGRRAAEPDPPPPLASVGWKRSRARTWLAMVGRRFRQ